MGPFGPRGPFGPLEPVAPSTAGELASTGAGAGAGAAGAASLLSLSLRTCKRPPGWDFARVARHPSPQPTNPARAGLRLHPAFVSQPGESNAVVMKPRPE